MNQTDYSWRFNLLWTMVCFTTEQKKIFFWDSNRVLYLNTTHKHTLNEITDSIESMKVTVFTIHIQQRFFCTYNVQWVSQVKILNQNTSVLSFRRNQVRLCCTSEVISNKTHGWFNMKYWRNRWHILFSNKVKYKGKADKTVYVFLKFTFLDM